MNDWLNGADGPLTVASWVCVYGGECRGRECPVEVWTCSQYSGCSQEWWRFALSFYCSHTCFSTNAPFNCVHSDLTKQSMLVFTSAWSCSVLKNVFIYHLPSLDFHVCMVSLTKPPVVFFFALLKRSLLCPFFSCEWWKYSCCRACFQQ